MSNLFSLEINKKGHSESVTSISIPFENSNIIVSGSRDKTLIVWEISKTEEFSIVPLKRLKGHSHFISDVKFSSDGQFCISSSWDNSLRLWDVGTGKTIQNFLGHQKDVLSLCFSKDERQIVCSPKDINGAIGGKWDPCV